MQQSLIFGVLIATTRPPRCAGQDVFRSAAAQAAFEEELLRDVIPTIVSRYSVCITSFN